MHQPNLTKPKEPKNDDHKRFWFAYDKDGYIVQYGQGNAPYAELKHPIICKIKDHHINTYKTHNTQYVKELEIIALFGK